jgi:hypothetical protein
MNPRACLDEEEKSPVPAGIRTPDRSARSLVTIPITLSRITLLRCTSLFEMTSEAENLRPRQAVFVHR